MSAAEDGAGQAAVAVAEDVRVLLVNRSPQTPGGVFEKQVTFPVPLGLEQLEFGVGAGPEMFLGFHQEVFSFGGNDGPGHDNVWRDGSQVASLPLCDWGSGSVHTQQLKVIRRPAGGPATSAQPLNVFHQVMMLQESDISKVFPVGIPNQTPQGPHVPVVELIVIGGTSQVGWLRANLLPSNADFTKPALNTRPWHTGLAEVICVGFIDVAAASGVVAGIDRVFC